MKRVVVTGARGFVGSNLMARLRSRVDIVPVGIDVDAPVDLTEALSDADVVYHLAGVNRPENEKEFTSGNVDFMRQVLDTLHAAGSRATIVVSSSIQAATDNAYGRSKRQAEELLDEYRRTHDVPVHVFRLPNVFGKWSRPFYNSVVATFCHQAAHGERLRIENPDRVARLLPQRTCHS